MKTEKERQVLRFVFELLYKRNLITEEEYRKLVVRTVEGESHESLHL